MNYINQLTKDDARELFIVLTGVGKTFDITLEDDLLCGKNHRTNTSYLIDLDDYYVDGIDSCCVVRDALVIYQEYEK